MALEVQVRKARLNDAEIIAKFVNSARTEAEAITRLDVADRFSQVGFIIAEYHNEAVGLVGFQVENLVIRVTDFLIAPAIDRVVAGKALVAAMEQAGEDLQAEACILFLPPNPSQELVSYWEIFEYDRKPVSKLPRAWREASHEWSTHATEVMIKQLREDMTHKPM